MKFIFLSFLLYFSYVLALYGPKDGVTMLSAKNFDKLVLKSNAVWVVEFFAPWCGHCKALAPEYKKAANKANGVRFAAIDCDQEANKPTCGRYGIQGFPTIKLFPGDKTGSQKIPVDYQGERKSKPLLTWAQARIPNIVEQVKSLEKFYSKNNDTLKLLLFTDKTKTSPLYKGLALEAKGKCVFGEVRKGGADQKDFQVETYPSLFAINPSGQATKYEGALKYLEIKKFLKSLLKGDSSNDDDNDDNNSDSSDDQKNEPELPKREFVENIPQLKYISDFHDHCLTKTEEAYSALCFIAFLPPLEPEFEESVQQHEQLIKNLKNLNKNLFEDNMLPNVYISWVDGYENSKIVQKFGVSSDLPSGMLISPKKKMYVPLLSGFSEKDIESFVRDTAKGKGKPYPYDFEFGLPENPQECGDDSENGKDESEGQCKFNPNKKDEL